MTLYTITAIGLTGAYLTLAIWAGIITVKLRRQDSNDDSWPILATVAFACAIWAIWYAYLLIWHPSPGGVTQMLNRTVHLPTITLFTVVCAWRGQRP